MFIFSRVRKNIKIRKNSQFIFFFLTTPLSVSKILHDENNTLR